MNPKEIEIRLTADGSTTLYRKDIDETYHSSHGALQEAKHVFIQNGLAQFSKKSSITVLEIGFGTGLNALLTALYADDNKINLEYHGLEALPLEEAIWKQVNYTQLIDDQRIASIFEEMHAAQWNTKVKISAYFQLKKIHDTLQKFEANPEHFDLIYFDAFGPRAQEEMWRLELFEKLILFLKPGGCLTTYCAKGSVKRDLKTAGFQVVSLPGPPGKREMTQAWKP